MFRSQMLYLISFYCRQRFKQEIALVQVVVRGDNSVARVLGLCFAGPLMHEPGSRYCQILRPVKRGIIGSQQSAVSMKSNLPI
jgi:hypothetical protein